MPQLLVALSLRRANRRQHRQFHYSQQMRRSGFVSRNLIPDLPRPATLATTPVATRSFKARITVDRCQPKRAPSKRSFTSTVLLPTCGDFMIAWYNAERSYGGRPTLTPATGNAFCDRSKLFPSPPCAQIPTLDPVSAQVLTQNVRLV